MNKGFTLVELLISVVIGMVIMNGMIFYYQNITNNFSLAKQIGLSYQVNESFSDKYKELKTKFPILQTSTGSVSLNGIGFQGMVFSNSKKTEGFFLGIYDVNRQAIITTNTGVNLYSKFTPVIIMLDGLLLNDAINSIESYINGLNNNIKANQNSFIIFNDLKLIKFKFSKINDSSIGKLDYTIINYYDDIYGVKIDLNGNLNDLNPYNISIID